MIIIWTNISKLQQIFINLDNCFKSFVKPFIVC